MLMLDASARETPTKLIRWRSLDVLSPTIGRVWLQRDDISFRLVPWGPPYSSAWKSWWAIRFGPDSEGVGNAKVLGGTQQVSLSEQKIREADAPGVATRGVGGGNATPLPQFVPVAFAGEDGTGRIELSCAGVTIRVGNGFDGGDLRRVLQVVRELR